MTYLLKILTWLLALVLIIVALQNQHWVLFHILPGWSLDLPLTLCFFIFLVGGMLIGLFIGAMSIWRQRQQIKRLQKEVQRVSEQLAAQRVEATPKSVEHETAAYLTMM